MVCIFEMVWLPHAGLCQELYTLGFSRERM